MSNIVKTVFDNAERLTVTVMLVFIVLALGYVVYALALGKIPTPGDYKRVIASTVTLQTRCDKTDETLATVTSALADARVLHAAATVRIEFLELDNKRKDAEIIELRSRVARLETEVDVRRAQEWNSRKDT